MIDQALSPRRRAAVTIVAGHDVESSRSCHACDARRIDDRDHQNHEGWLARKLRSCRIDSQQAEHDIGNGNECLDQPLHELVEQPPT